MKNIHEKFPDNGDENYEYLKILNEIVNETTTEVLMGLIDSEDDAIFQYLIELGWTPPNKWEKKEDVTGQHCWFDPRAGLIDSYPHLTVECVHCGVTWDIRKSMPAGVCEPKDEETGE